MPSVHAKLSPSASYTWMACSGAIPLVNKLKIVDSGSSIYADKGTAMHTVMEVCINDKRRPGEFVGMKIEVSPAVTVTIDTEMAKIVKPAVDYVNSLDSNVLFCEEKVLVNKEEGIFGTVDVISITDDMIEVVDLKTGRLEVPAYENWQLMIYMIGVYNEFGRHLGISRFRVTIIQPVLFDEPQSYDFDLEELQEFEAKVLAAAKKIKTHPNSYTPTEKGCRWCKARHACPAQINMVNELASVDFKDVKDSMPKDELERLYALVGPVSQTVKAIEQETLRRLVAGIPVKGFRLAPSTPTRAWDPAMKNDLKEALSMLFEENVYLTDRDLLSPAQLDKALKEEDTFFSTSEYLAKKDPSPVVVAEDSKKPMWSSENAAKQDFAVYTTKQED